MKTEIILLFAFLLFFNSTVFASQISTDEKNGILLMREEEKMAHDVYISLYEKWNIPIFNNISRSETMHFNATGILIESFDLQDPVLAGIGNFQNQELKQLYDSLTEKGNHSIIDALEVGAFIEELDIEDLQNLISSSKNDTILQVYENLLRASGNHLRAFTGQLSARNTNYIPTVLTEDKFNSILNTTHQMGNGNGNCMIQQQNCINQGNAGNGKMRRRRGRN